jgi:isoleucyl-tRNA synthetase
LKNLEKTAKIWYFEGMASEKEVNHAKENFLGDGTEFNLPQLEEKVLKFWDERGVFEKSLKKNETNGEKFVFYEGPPYANGRPALHHILARVVKDVVLRFKTMQGYYVPRRAGWDTHGLPVEMAAEKALGFKTKRDIEQFGVQKFNEEAKKQVWIHRDEWERLTNRIGYWLDLRNAYVTYAPEYIESIWWTLAQISKRKVDGESLLFKGHKVVPWCTRCGTALSSHELAQGYKEVVDRSVYVKFKLKPNQKFGEYTTKDSAYILSWTTTPWTLPGNVALAVGEKISYTALRVKDIKELYLLASDLVKAVFKNEEVEIVHDDIKGKDLVGLEYEPLFEVAPLQKPEAYKIYAADFVTTTEGTGVVHTAVMYGEDDYELGKKVGLPQHHTVSEEGKFLKDVPDLAGEYVKSREAEDRIFALLKERGNLLRIENYTHEYPFCWRCGTALLYYARTSWFIGMSRLRAELLKNNETIHWMPEHVKEGRFGEWLREAKDWNLSRERYWGAPLPIWECAKCGKAEVVESLEQLSQLAGGAKNKYWVMRHGEAESNMLHIADCGSGNFHLTPKGTEEVELSVKNFKKSLKDEKIDLIFTSDILRAKETGEIASDAFGVKTKTDKRLNEINWGVGFEGKPIARYVETIPTYEGRFENVAEGAEPLRHVRQRTWNFLEDCEKEYTGKNILIISHGDPIWMMMSAALGWSEKRSIEETGKSEGHYPKTGQVRELELKIIPRDDTGLVDLHRPFIDEISWACGVANGTDKKCDGTMKRVRAVADVWYDSGAMPYAQAHYPFDIDRKHLEYPADYIAEGIDQTRGWFYTMLAIATALGYDAPYRNVITFGLMNDKFGNKMSKSKGNVIEPFEIIDKYGVDAVRWYFYAGTPFGEPKNFDESEVGKKLRQVHLIIYNSFVFWRTYAKRGIGDWREIAERSENVLDRWILARFEELAGSVTTKLEKYQVREAALEIEGFVDDLSRWYIRRSRRRLQRPDDGVEGVQDYEAASATLGFVLMQLVKLMAPFTPFFSEILHTALGGGKESVHLEEWPAGQGGAQQSRDDEKLIKNMAVVRQLAAVGLAKRAEAKIKVRQPLQSLTIKNETLKNDEKLLEILADEVNVKEILFNAAIEGDAELDVAITPALREEGLLRDVARMVQELRQKAGLEPTDQIALMLDLPEPVRAVIEKHEHALKNDVGAATVEHKRTDKFEAEEEGNIEGQTVWIGLRKLP